MCTHMVSQRLLKDDEQNFVHKFKLNFNKHKNNKKKIEAKRKIDIINLFEMDIICSQMLKRVYLHIQ